MFRIAAFVTLALLVSSSPAGAQTLRASADPHGGHGAATADDSLAAKVREATSIYRDIAQATADGYAQFGGCVSGPEVGAMGVHFVKGALVDATLEIEHPRR